MACGCATICTNVGGLTDLVFPGHNGFLCDPTAEALSGAINKLIEDPVLLKEYQESDLWFENLLNQMLAKRVDSRLAGTGLDLRKTGS